VAFLGHLVEAEDVVLIDESLANLPSTSLEGLVERFARVADAGLIDERVIRSPTGRSVRLSFIGMNVTARQIARARDEQNLGWIVEKIHRAAALARASGCRTLGLGGYTSSLTGAGLRLSADGLVITSGNARTVGMAIRALEREAKKRSIALDDVSVGIVGAPGSIASACAQLLAERAPELVLVVRRQSSRASALVDRIRSASPQTLVCLTTDLGALRSCSLIISSSSAEMPLLEERHLGSAAAVICDIAVPGDVAPDVRHRRPDVSVIDGGIVRLPDPDFSLRGIRLAPGCAFACLAETLLLGLERRTSNGYRGRVTAAGVREVLAFADTHGFLLAEPEEGRAAWP
jgi:predicted amino acid dehydrogenase